jgi:ATP-binding cassette subfamily B protein
VVAIEFLQVLAIFARPLLIGLVIDAAAAAVRCRGWSLGLYGPRRDLGLRFALGGLSQYFAGIAATGC